MKWPVCLLVCFSVAWMSLQAVLAEEKVEYVAKDLAAQFDELTEVLKTVTDMDSAKAAQAKLSEWQESPLFSQKPKVQQEVCTLVFEDELLNQAYQANRRQIERLKKLDAEIYSHVMTALNGGRPQVNLAEHLDRTANLLNQIKNEEDLHRLRDELSGAFKPFAEMMHEDFMWTMDYIESNPVLQPALKKQKQATDRLNRENPELAQKVRLVMLGEETAKKLDRLLVEAQENAQRARSLSGLTMLEMAIDNLAMDNGRLPFADQAQGGDLTIDSGKKLMDVLTNVHNERNPKGRQYYADQSNPPMIKNGVLLDSWGKAFRVTLDTSMDNKIKLPAEYGDQVVEVAVLVDSAGPDGDFKTVEDNITSWSE